MKHTSTILAGLTGTTIMTLFSYAVSKQKKENFNEPELLGYLLQKQLNSHNYKPYLLVGWLLHYTLGCLWADIYTTGLSIVNKRPNNKRATLFGLGGGFLGVFIWKAMFKRQRKPLPMHYPQFYLQLFIAHLVFALSASNTYDLLIVDKQINKSIETSSSGDFAYGENKLQ